jgi:hypothetical protein
MLGSIAQNVLRDLAYRSGKKWNTTSAQSDQAFSTLLSRTENCVKIIAGEADPRVFSQEGIVSQFKTLLERRNATVKFVFGTLAEKGGRTETVEEAKERFCNDNKALYELFRDNSDKVQIYVAHRRPELHYSVADGQYVFVEGQHHPYMTRETRISFNDRKLGQFWDKRFDAFLREKLDKKELTPVTL